MTLNSSLRAAGRQQFARVHRTMHCSLRHVRAPRWRQLKDKREWHTSQSPSTMEASTTTRGRVSWQERQQHPEGPLTDAAAVRRGRRRRGAARADPVRSGVCQTPRLRAERCAAPPRGVVGSPSPRFPRPSLHEKVPGRSSVCQTRTLRLHLKCAARRREL